MVDWWVPVVSGFAGGLLPALVAWLALRSAGRTAADERAHALLVQQAQHDHERAQHLRDSAAHAFADAESAIDALDPFYVGIHDRGASYPDHNDATVHRSLRSMATLMVNGWTPEIRTAAKDLRSAIERLFDIHQVFWLEWHGLDASHEHRPEALERHSETKTALERYRCAISDTV